MHGLARGGQGHVRRGPNEILVSEVTRTRAAAAGLRFDDRGPHRLKGLPGERRLFAYVNGEPPSDADR